MKLITEDLQTENNTGARFETDNVQGVGNKPTFAVADAWQQLWAIPIVIVCVVLGNPMPRLYFQHIPPDGRAAANPTTEKLPLPNPTTDTRTGEKTILTTQLLDATVELATFRCFMCITFNKTTGCAPILLY